MPSATIMAPATQLQNLKTKATTQCIGPREVGAGYGARIGVADSCAKVLGPRAVDLFIVPSCFLFGPKLC